MRKIYLIAIWIMIAGVSAWAVPAKRDGRMMTAADGSTKMVFLHGNEYAHYLTDAEGTVLDEETLLPLNDEQLANERKGAIRQARQAISKDRLIVPKGPVILVSYSDEAFQHDQALMTDWAMGENFTYNGATGSVRQYFRDVSLGQFEMEIDVYGPVTVSKNAAYYGSNVGQNDAHPDELVVEACQLAAAQGADFSQYDSDDDGYVDWVVILYAGKGEADSYITNRIWPHQGELHDTGKTIQLDGKTVDHYCCLNEIAASGQLSGIGTFCHEFGHIMGLPDIYATDNNATHKTSGMWDVMDYGCYNNNDHTPCGYSAYERWFMGWTKPVLINEAVSVSMPDIYTYNDAVYMTQSGDSIPNILRPNPNIFYMFENRQNVGWDTYIPGHGLIITRINYRSTWWSYNTVNNTASNMGIDILEADGIKPTYNQFNRNNGYFGKQGDAYPTDSVNTFSDVTDYPVTNIVETDGVISFDVLGGGQPMVLEVENGQSAAMSIKIMQNGQLRIMKNGKIYDLLGREL